MSFIWIIIWFTPLLPFTHPLFYHSPSTLLVNWVISCIAIVYVNYKFYYIIIIIRNIIVLWHIKCSLSFVCFYTHLLYLFFYSKWSAFTKLSLYLSHFISSRLRNKNADISLQGDKHCEIVFQPKTLGAHSAVFQVMDINETACSQIRVYGICTK